MMRDESPSIDRWGRSSFRKRFNPQFAGVVEETGKIVPPHNVQVNGIN